MEKVRREKMQVREKVGESQNTVFFQCFVASEGRKIGSKAGEEVPGQMRDEKNARCCGAKQILKEKVTKHVGFGPLLEVEVWKKCTPMWRQAHLQVKSVKAHQVRTAFGS